MQTHGYERSDAWRRALALVDQVRVLTATFDDDPFAMAGKLRALAVDLPAHTATTFEQLDYDSVRAHAAGASSHLFKLQVAVQLASHLGLVSARQLGDLLKKIDALDEVIAALPDELFEDDGLEEVAQAA